MLTKRFVTLPGYIFKRFKAVTKIILKVLLVLYLVVAIWGLVGLSMREQYMPTDLAAPQGAFANIEGTQIYYTWKLTNVKKPGVNPKNIVLLHGFAASSFSYRNQVDYLLAQGSNVLTLDLPGFGLSQQGVNFQKLGADNQANTVIKLMDNLGLPDVVIVGHSMGGGIAQRIALLQPNRVKGLVLIDSVDLSGNNNNLSFLSFLNNPLGLQLPFGILGSPNLIKAGLQANVFNPTTITDDWISGYYTPYTLYKSTANLIAHSFGSTKDLIIYTKNITMPTLVIVGESDSTIPKSMVSNLKQIPSQQFVTIPSSAHLPHEEQPLIVNQQIGDWLKGINP